jgi:uncharacterized alkaline shock family protein YloU
MAEQAESSSATQQRQSSSGGQQSEESKQLDALHTKQGDTTIAETVVEKVAGVAVREVPGVHAMGSPTRRAISNVTERIPGSQTNVSGGVAVEKGERQTAIDVSIVVEYGASIVEVGNGIRSNVITSVERTTGLEVLEVNVNVSDVHLPQDDTTTSQNESRRPE